MKQEKNKQNHRETTDALYFDQLLAVTPIKSL